MKLSKKFRRFAKEIYNSAIASYIGLKTPNLKLASKIVFHGVPDIRGRGSINIGSEAVICSNSKNNSIGVLHKVLLHSVNENSLISLGNNVGISGSVLCAADFIKVGKDTLIGSGCIITDSDHHSIYSEERKVNTGIRTKGITIGHSCFLGARTIVLKGVVLGDNCVVSAGSVVKSSFPANSLIGGNPAKLKGYIN